MKNKKTTLGVFDKVFLDLCAYNMWSVLRKDETIGDEDNKYNKLYLELDKYIKNDFNEANGKVISLEFEMSNGEAIMIDSTIKR